MAKRLAFIGITFMLFSLVMTNCSRQQHQSPIVDALEQSGSGKRVGVIRRNDSVLVGSAFAAISRDRKHVPGSPAKG